MNARRWLSFVLVAAWCGCQGDSLPRVRYGEEACAHCRMIINDQRFAAAWTDAAGETLKFDDVGCLVAFIAAEPKAEGRRWIRGYQADAWLDAEQAYFVHGPQLQTPMASGLAAVSSEQAAEALAGEWQGTTLRFADLPRFLQARQRVPETVPDSAGAHLIHLREESP